MGTDVREPLKELSACGLPAALEVMGERWSFMILRASFNGIHHFEEFLTELGIARNILSNRLAKLVENGILKRDPCAEDKRKIEYRLTDKGLDLLPAMVALRQWGQKYGAEVVEKFATRHGVDVAFEAAVAGGIPILKSLGEGLAANHINWVAGIINGTGNYILTEMEQGGRAFQEVLEEAQSLGYAEADPTFDVEGVDAAHKLTIIASIAFGIPLQFSKVYMEGISRITIEDVKSAAQFGYRIKHLGIAKDTGHGIELRVHPTLIPRETMLSAVNGVMNAIMIDGDAVGPTMFYGAGAGAEPTASAVVADIIEMGRALTVDHDERVPYLGFHADQMSDDPILTIDDVSCSFYLRLHVQDKPGVLANITRILSDNHISIEAMVQKETEEGLVPIVMMTHKVLEGDMNAALAAIAALDTVDNSIMRIRVETLDA